MVVRRFALCPECQAQYSALRLDPDASYSLNVMPLGSLLWKDEHPNGMLSTDRTGPHASCAASVMKLASARTALWRTGAVPERSRELWEDARQLLPEWPGFSRLTLNEDQRASLDGCASEMDDLMQAIAARFPHMTTTDQGGGVVHVTATREPPVMVKRWWQFWK